MIKLIDGTTISYSPSVWNMAQNEMNHENQAETVTITTPDGYKIKVQSSEWISDVIIDGPFMERTLMNMDEMNDAIVIDYPKKEGLNGN